MKSTFLKLALNEGFGMKDFSKDSLICLIKYLDNWKKFKLLVCNIYDERLEGIPNMLNSGVIVYNMAYILAQIK